MFATCGQTVPRGVVIPGLIEAVDLWSLRNCPRGCLRCTYQSKVKYVILSHAHADHDGGAKLLQDEIPGVHLVYGQEDLDAIDKAATHASGKPKRDKVGDDGMVVSVGDASVGIVTMSGDTPGTLSYLFEIRDHGKPLRVAYVGGTAIPFNGSAAYYDTYIASSKKIARAAADYGATALLSNHAEFDDAYFKAHAAANRRPGETIHSM